MKFLMEQDALDFSDFEPIDLYDITKTFDTVFDLHMFLRNKDCETIVSYMIKHADFYKQKGKKFWDIAINLLLGKHKHEIHCIYVAGKRWPKEFIPWNEFNKIMAESEELNYITRAGKYWPHDKVDYKLFSEVMCRHSITRRISWPVFYNCKTGEPVK